MAQHRGGYRPNLTGRSSLGREGGPLANSSRTTSARGLEDLAAAEGAIEGLYDDPFGHASFGVAHRVDKAVSWGSFLLAAARAESRWRFCVQTLESSMGLEVVYLDCSAPTAQDVETLAVSAKVLGRETVASKLHRSAFADLDADRRREVDEVVAKAVDQERRLLDRRVIDVLAEDVVPCEDVVNNDVTVDLSQDEFDALISFAFSLGTRALRRQGLLEAINAGDWRSDDAQLRAKGIAAIEAAFMGVRYSSVDPTYVPSLTGRRGREAEKFLREVRGALARAPRA